METNAELSLSRWDTALSDLDDLFFVSLLDRDNALRLTVEDGSRQRYEVVVERPGPYRMADEQFLVHYWAITEEGRGWTFQVVGADWVRDLELLDHYTPGIEHFVIATYDTCLEVLAANEPRIRPL